MSFLICERLNAKMWNFKMEGLRRSLAEDGANSEGIITT